MKYAVYVEGKAEMLFVADVLYKYSSYSPDIVGFQCINLNSNDFEYVKYPNQGDEHSLNYFQIVNVNNDHRVISKLKQDIPNLVQQGYEIIIGLRDVFGSDYDKICPQQVIDTQLISEMLETQTLQLKYGDADTRLHFAIMEYETWMMALLDNFIINKGDTPVNVFATVGVNHDSDFEKTVYHPYNIVREIYHKLNTTYGKHERDYYSFLESISKEDYETLRNSKRCRSFKSFIDSLLSWTANCNN